MIKKLYRYTKLYGLKRTIVKAAGRSQKVFLKWALFRFNFSRKKSKVSLIGCGQFGFSTISYFLHRSGKVSFNHCYDIDESKQKFASQFWGYKPSGLDVINTAEESDIVYIASNHHSHTDYA